MKVRFQADTHTYWDEDGVDLPGVTAILEQAGLIDFSRVPKERLEYARIRGTYVHNACELYDRGDLDEMTLDTALKGYLEGWKQFRQDFQPEMLANEQVVFSEKYRYAGRIDRVARICQKVALIDIKTSVIYPSSAIQLAGYEQAWNEQYKAYKIQTKLIVRLKKEGSYELSTKDFFNKNDITVFNAALALYYWRKNKGLLKLGE